MTRRLLYYGVLVLLVWGAAGCTRQQARTNARPLTPPAAAQELHGKVSPAYVRDTIKLLQDEYVEEVDVASLLAGARAGLESYLKENGIKDDRVAGFNCQSENGPQLFTSLLTDVLSRHQGKVVDEKLVYASLRGMMGALKDPYSVAMDPREYRQLTEQMSGGNFGGIGVYIERDKKRDNQITVSEPVEETPAARAGLKAGDLILRINDQPTRGMDLDLAAEKIRGPVGTQVRLSVKRDKQDPREYKMLRELIHVKSAAYHALDGHIGYIKLRFFGQQTDDEFEQALREAEKNQARGIILDLRNNGGGYIKAALDVCSKFLPRGTLVVSVVNYRRNNVEPDKAYGAVHAHLPIVVLVNNYSASASEITAGALQDTGTGVLVGMKTFGKGSVQTIHDLPDGGALKFTIAHYLTPKGRNINKKGIQPDLDVEMSPDLVGEPGDKQLEAAEGYLKKKLSLQ